MKPTLYDDQRYLLQMALHHTQNGTKAENVLITSPSGSGKTYMIAGLVDELLQNGFAPTDILIIPPTYEIASQIQNRLIQFVGEDVTQNIPILGSVVASRLGEQSVSSDPLSTLSSSIAPSNSTSRKTTQPNVIGDRREARVNNTFKVIIIDEAHHSEAETYKEVLRHYSNAVVYGFTATPMRNDEKQLSSTYQHIVSGLSIKELIKAGRLAEFDYIVPNHTHMVTFNSDYLDVDGKDFDAIYKPQKLDRVLYGDMVDTWLHHARDRKTICFVPSIEESRLLAKLFVKKGIKAAHVDGSTIPFEERNQIIEDFRSGNIQVLCNQGLISEGFDVPDASCVLLARPTNSVILYLQQCFRAMRRDPKNPQQKAIILDHANNISRFGKLDADRNWTLTMDAAQKALAKTTKQPKRVLKEQYDIDPYVVTDSEMIQLAKVTNPYFEADVEHVFTLEDVDMKPFKELCRIQRQYHIKSVYSKSWAYLCALHFGFEVPKSLSSKK